MARLVAWQGRVAELTLASGPASAGSGSNTLADGSEQSFAGDNFALRFDLSFPPSQAANARREYGWMLGLHNGANATRYEYRDRTEKTPQDVGEPSAAWTGGAAWAGGAWADGHGTVAVAANAATGESIVRLANAKWGHGLDPGDVIGFSPSCYGAYWITEVLSGGVYRVAPRLRHALDAATHRATFYPRLALRFVPGSVSYGTFNPGFAAGRGGQFVEVFDEYVTTYFGD